ncbi:carboxymuconolactone decarboxylase family protein [Paraburkholderia sp. MMS20-SJTN17]|uniref:Carboxymuconolactone decarboxylase family protein n=1 Tax=Paraburkholderia translucens TaxID=2886945 RepID=A0ABS8KJA0_9BURK|nr:carboxymuconolactone decarboxylase family protein [Paraburkholderia sp. MMS20-SJTN17]MCC8404857.1 carboxymuconolactone decarboxylase family protein [Paraburkholderia sp. MMS20-SJTN17]
MSSYPVHTIESAPAQSQPVLRKLQQAFGLIPNIAATMADSPVLINGFIGLFERVHASSLTEPQIQTLLLTNAVTNASEWAVAFHTALGLQASLRRADVEAIRHGGLPDDARLAALSTLARTLIEKRGRLADEDRQRFVAAGFSAQQLLEVIAVAAASTITNYTGSVTQPPLETQFGEFAWQAPTR